ncbi:SDH family Clp fold serine proteinase [Lysinibacillus boronitolerans]|uniref:SDH family Clp fold serine proteinase n=1 Tax=Lysinibacillus boronitolerans TaxID=309788 RepID=UPI002896F201|nr:ATP-dependent Clp protease proteolytic subunit [Lysinibacillus boronitolerans]
MPNWNEISQEIGNTSSPQDAVRKKYLSALSELTGRNTIIYYSGWLQKQELANGDRIHVSVNDNDKAGFMSAISNLDKSKGLDLILHTPGGDIAATESIVNYLKSIFGNDVRAIVPQLAMSAGTMIACSCSSIVMGNHSSIGPIDPQIAGIPAHGIIEEFDTAAQQISLDQTRAILWQPIIAKYSPTLIGQCQKAIAWSTEMVKEWLRENMLQSETNPVATAESIVNYLGSYAMNKSHARHISATKAASIGLKIDKLEDDPDLQDAVLSVHHSTIHTLGTTNAIKIIENQDGISYIQAHRGVR